MNHEKALQYYASVLDDDLTIGANHLLDDLPTTFTATDFLYFFALRDRFWSDVADEEERLMTSAAMTECYLSAWLHIHSGVFRFNERVHDLEHCILYGDLLSGAFSEHLIALDKIGLLEQWLDLLQKINRELLTYSLEGRSTMEKKSCLVKRLVEYLVPGDDQESMMSDAEKLLVENTLPGAASVSLAALRDCASDAPGTAWSSSVALRALRE